MFRRSSIAFLHLMQNFLISKWRQQREKYAKMPRLSLFTDIFCMDNMTASDQLCGNEFAGYVWREFMDYFRHAHKSLKLREIEKHHLKRDSEVILCSLLSTALAHIFARMEIALL